MVIGVIFAGATFSFDTIITSWQQAGFFSIILPFLLIFALTFGILTRVQIFKENKAINAIIAAVVSLMALQVPMIPEFFSQLFPRMGLALGVILILMIIIGFFASPESPIVNYVLLGIGVIIVIVVLIQSAGAVGWESGQWWGDNWPVVAGAMFIIILVVIIVAATGSGKTGQRPDPKDFQGAWARPPK